MNPKNPPRRITVTAAGALTLLVAACAYSSAISGCRRTGATKSTQSVGQPMTADEQKSVEDAVDKMTACGLADDGTLGKDLLARHIIKAAKDDDPYLAYSEKSGDTPYAYTLSDGKKPSAIVLAPRFFTQSTPAGRAALLVHEFGHYRAYVATGKSDEVDGYKAEYDKHGKLGLNDSDGLVYYSMLDGVEEYVVPKYPAYAKYPDVKKYISQ